MPGIVCAIRGGPASQPTIEKAIASAQKENQEVYFLYVVDLDFLVQTSSTRLQTITKEMDQMGEFILLTAQAKAQSRQVPAHGVVRHGKVREQIIELCKEIDADFIVLGRPRGNDAANVFTQDHLSQFADFIRQQSGVQVIFAEEN